MGYLEAHSWDRSLAHVLIWRIACPKRSARSSIPGYSFCAGSKHASKAETITSNGGSTSTSPSNHRIVLARRIAESMASGSVIFRRTQHTQRALFAFSLRKASKLHMDTRSPSRGAPVRWCVSSAVIGSRTVRSLNLRNLWNSLYFVFPNARSMRRNGLVSDLPTHAPNARHNVGYRSVPRPQVHHGLVDAVTSPGKPLPSAHPTI